MTNCPKQEIKVVWWHKEGLEFSEQNREAKLKVLDLLKQLECRHDIAWEVIGDWNGEDEKDVYHTVFLHFKNRLRKNSGAPVTEIRSNRGNILLHDIVCFEWCGEPLCFANMPKAADLIEGMVRRGPASLWDWVSENRRRLLTNDRDSEERVVRDFLDKHVELGFPGKVRTDVPLRRRAKEDSDGFVKAFSYATAKIVDLLHKAPDGSVDVIEAKLRLNWTGLGQALGYASWYAKLNSLDSSNVHPVIICRQTDEMVVSVCEHYGVKVVLVPK